MRDPFTITIITLAFGVACSSHSAAPPVDPVSTNAAPANSDVPMAPSAAGSSSVGTAESTKPQTHTEAANDASAPHHPDTTVSTTATDKTASGSPAPIVATIEARSGSNVTGTITLTPVSDGVRAQVRVKGATPGLHGLHFHENADCSAADGTSAKGHYNPTHQPHALPPGAKRHLGDLGNIVVASSGEGTLDTTLTGATLAPNAPNTLLGTAVILHADKDDGSQPTGNSGARIGCAVIAR